MKKERKISIITPIYNAEKYIRKCIESMINQTYQNIEIILINDGSTDNSLEICQEYQKKDKRIKIVNEKNQGVSAARNKGIEESTGDYITFVDADDYIDIDAIERIGKIIDNNLPTMIKLQYYREINNKIFKQSKNTYTGFVDIKNDKRLIYDMFFINNEFGAVYTTTFQKNLIKNLKFNENFIVAEDYDFYLECIKKSNSIYISNDAYYHYIDNPNSVINNYEKEKIIKKIDNHLMINKKNIEELSNDDKKYIIAIENNTYNLLLEYIKMYAKSNNYSNYTKLKSDIKRLNSFKNISNIIESNKKKHYFNKIISKNKRTYFYRIKIEAKLKELLKKIVVKIYTRRDNSENFNHYSNL